MNATDDSEHISPYQRDADAVEVDWRAVQTDMQVVTFGTFEGMRLAAEAGRLRAEHHRLSNEAVRNGRAVRPFPTR